MPQQPICELCGKSSPEGAIVCAYCGNGFSSDEEWASCVIGAPVWGRVRIHVINSADCGEVIMALRRQWEAREHQPTQQCLFPFQAEKFMEGVSDIDIFAPKDSYLALASSISASFPEAVNLSFVELEYDDIYAKRGDWLASRSSTLQRVGT